LGAPAVIVDLTCGPFPGPGSSSERRVSMNPMHEFIHHDDNHVQDAFHRFRRAHSKNYKDAATHEKRKHNFRQNLRSVVTASCDSDTDLCARRSFFPFTLDILITP